MPTWPSGSKAGTTNVDAGTDSVSNARADIKQNIDNVNEIIDIFNISSPSDEELLQYSSSSGKFEQVAKETLGGGSKRAVFYITSGSYFGTGSTSVYRKVPLVMEANGGAVDSFATPVIGDSAGGYNANDDQQEDSAGSTGSTFVLSAGFYQFLFAGNWPIDGGGKSTKWVLVDEDSDTRSTIYSNTGSDTSINKSLYKYVSGTEAQRTFYVQYANNQGSGEVRDPEDVIFSGGQSQDFRLIVIKHS